MVLAVVVVVVPSSPRPWYPLTSPLRIQLSLRILLLIFTFPCSNTLISSRQTLLFSNTDNRGAAPLRTTFLFVGNFHFETGRPPGARIPISNKMSNAPKAGSCLSRGCHSDEPLFSFSTPMTQVTGRPPGTIKSHGIYCPTLIHTRNYQDTGQPDKM